MRSQNQKESVRRAFTLQAAEYAANAVLSNRRSLTRLVEAVNPTENSRVLDVATGPGFVAEAFSDICQTVIGVDITWALLVIAKQCLRDCSN